MVFTSRKNRSITLLCFKKFCCREKGCHHFPSKFVCLTTPKNFVGHYFVPQKTSGIETERRFHDYSSKNSCLTVSKTFAAEPFCVTERFWYRDRQKERVSQFSVEYFCSSGRNLSRRVISCLVKFLVTGQREGITIFHGKFLSQSLEKFCR